MQRCPYIHEMKERLLGELPPPMEQPTVTKKIPTPPPFNMEQQQLLPSQPVATIVKLNPDGLGSQTTPASHRIEKVPLLSSQDNSIDFMCRGSKYPKNAKTSLFIIMSFVYAKLLVVVCITYVISDAVTHYIPLYYYEGFFTYLYGMSILFLLYVFCFLLQESTCCNGNEKEVKVKPPPAKDKAAEKEKEKKEEEKKKKEEKAKKEKDKKEKEKDKGKDKKDKKEKREKLPRKMRDIVLERTSSKNQSTYRRNSEGVVDSTVPVPVVELSNQIQAANVSQDQTPAAAPPAAPAAPPIVSIQPPPPAPSSGGKNDVAADVEAGTVVKRKSKRKTTQNDASHGSFFLRIGAIAFGLGTMIYSGLEFGSFFEVPFSSKCYMILRGVNPVLQMIFTFMQMYFIFMNSRLNIHRFKVVARFGLMHVVATNICVWIRTLVLEYLKEITIFYKNTMNDTVPVNQSFAASIKAHTIRNANTVLGTHLAVPDVVKLTAARAITAMPPTTSTSFRNLVHSTARAASTTLRNAVTTLPTTTSPRYVYTTPKPAPTTFFRMFHTNAPPMTFTTPSATTTTTIKTTARNLWQAFTTTVASSPTIPSTTTTSTTTSIPLKNFVDFRTFNNFASDDFANVADEQLSVSAEDFSNPLIENSTELLNGILPQALKFFDFSNLTRRNPLDGCGRVNIMGNIVQDSAPYLYPFIIEYSLIGAAVIYVMWKHIGKNPRCVSQEDLEHRLEIMLSRRAVALAQVGQGRVDCVGASKGLFFGLLMLVASLICLILFFVLIYNKDFNLLAIYLADVSHCALMVLSIFAIIIGFVRVQQLKFKIEEQSDLNDILLRVSAFGLFLYAIFSAIAGHLFAFTKEPNLLVMITGILAVFQVILQLLFISDVSRRRVHLPEHDRIKPGRQVVTFLLICNVAMWIIYTCESKRVEANPVQIEFYGFLSWALIQRFTLPLCIFHRFHSAVTLAEIWKTTYKPRLE